MIAISLSSTNTESKATSWASKVSPSAAVAAPSAAAAPSGAVPAPAHIARQQQGPRPRKVNKVEHEKKPAAPEPERTSNSPEKIPPP